MNLHNQIFHASWFTNVPIFECDANIIISGSWPLDRWVRRPLFYTSPLQYFQCHVVLAGKKQDEHQRGRRALPLVQLLHLTVKTISIFHTELYIIGIYDAYRHVSKHVSKVQRFLCSDISGKKYIYLFQDLLSYM
jgi:hypothetical protein